MGSMTAGPPTSLSHLDADGRARMVDVGGKDVTDRTATATARFLTRPDVVALVRADDLPKADVLATARIAGIQGAKRTSDLIPLCHPLPVTKVTLDLDVEDAAVTVTAIVATDGKTGVEMEALTAVSVALLTVYDMAKAIDKGMTIEGVRLLAKSGGRSGDWRAEG